MSKADIKSVEEFWNSNPLFSGESEFEPGTRAFFEDHRSVYIEDVFANRFDKQKYLPPKTDLSVLDLGCGIGFWTIELLLHHPYQLVAADLTQRALDLTAKRLEMYGLEAELRKENAERMTFPDETFDHINCQGVIHHTPDTARAVSEIARVLKPGGTANISVYYRNIFLRNWKTISPMAKFIGRLGGKLKGRGRENIFFEDDINNITRLYDGDKNPIGKSYDRKMLIELVAPYFDVEESFLNFFPARSLPISIPRGLHRYLSRKMGFMLHFNMRKK